jgi:curved DNA-binding protein CbpA
MPPDFAAEIFRGASLFPEPERMAGQLKRHPLTELVREISAAELSGALRLVREQARTVIYFDAGEIIYAASNLRAHRLNEAVRRWNILSEQQLAGIQAKTSDLEFGTALVDAGTISRETLEELVARQVSEMLCHALLWTDGDWEFDPRVRVAGDVRVAIKTKQLLVESSRHLPVEFVASRFTNKSEKLYPATEATGDLNILPSEAFILTRVDAALSINELLVVGGLPETEILHIVYTLALGGFLRRESWPQALSPKETANAQRVKAASAKQDSPAETESKSAPLTKAANPVVEEQRDAQSEIEELLTRIRTTTDHYQMLAVRRSASAADIKRSYYALAKRFHPDRFRRDADDAQLAQIESAFARIAQSYETLKDKTLRAVYDSKLLNQEQEERSHRATASSRQTGTDFKPDASAANSNVSIPVKETPQAETPYQAEERFQQGLSALQQGNHAFAIAAFGEAARLAPNEARYHAYFGQALARDKRLRHSAEAEFKQAITLDGNNSSYRVMLAQFYYQIGLIRRARAELDNALSGDPKNKDALLLLGQLKR